MAEHYKLEKTKIKYNYEIRLVQGQTKFIIADRFTYSIDGLKFYLNGEIVFTAAPQKWNYVQRQLKVGE